MTARTLLELWVLHSCLFWPTLWVEPVLAALSVRDVLDRRNRALWQAASSCKWDLTALPLHVFRSYSDDVWSYAQNTLLTQAFPGAGRFDYDGVVSCLRDPRGGASADTLAQRHFPRGLEPDLVKVRALSGVSVGEDLMRLDGCGVNPLWRENAHIGEIS